MSQFTRFRNTGFISKPSFDLLERLTYNLDHLMLQCAGVMEMTISPSVVSFLYENIDHWHVRVDYLMESKLTAAHEWFEQNRRYPNMVADTVYEEEIYQFLFRINRWVEVENPMVSDDAITMMQSLFPKFSEHILNQEEKSKNQIRELIQYIQFK